MKVLTVTDVRKLNYIYKCDMSILYSNEFGIFISHQKSISLMYQNTGEESYIINSDLFKINVPYKRAKKKASYQKSSLHLEEGLLGKLKQEVYEIQDKFVKIINHLEKNDLLEKDVQDNNSCALNASEGVYNQTGRSLIQNTVGSNIGPGVTRLIGKETYIFPENSIFYAKDVTYIDQYLSGKSYDLILLDPPWWNKYIRRKRKKCHDVYNMMFNYDLKKLPIETLLKEDGLLVIWCTNSDQHINYLFQEMFPKWRLYTTSIWYWVKITLNGKPVCEFSQPPNKQPYEKIIFACRKRSLPFPKNGKLIVSVPSALHSHKPPLDEVLKEFLPQNPTCLEIFARYLIPRWTSYGNEVLRFQHESLFVKNT